MNVYSLLSALKELNVALSLEDGRLKVDAPEGVLTNELVNEIKLYKEEIITFLSTIEKEQATKIPVAPIKDKYPLSYAQNRLWILDQFKHLTHIYNVAMSYWLRGNVDTTLLAQAFHALVNRHEILRTRFVSDEGTPFQRIQNIDTHGYEFKTLDYTQKDDAKQKALIRSNAFANTPFNLEKESLIKTELIKVSEAAYVLNICIHHIISDEWSMHVLVADVMKEYEALKKGVKLSPLPLRIQYKDYAVWEQNNTSFKKAKNYWNAKFQEGAPILDFPADFSRPAMQSFDGAELKFEVTPSVSKQFKAQLEENGTTLFIGALTLVYSLLHCYTNQHEIVIGSPVSGRQHSDLEDQIGFYINTLALKQGFQGNDSFEELLKAVKANVLEAFDHQSYPFDALVSDLDIVRDTSRTPLFDVMVILEDNQKASVANFNAFDIEEIRLEKKTSKFDLTFWFKEDENGVLSFHIEYNTSLYEQARIERLGNHLVAMLAAVVQTPQEAIARLPILSASEVNSSLALGKGEKKNISPTNNLAAAFEEQVTATPEAIAIYFENETYTYRALNEKANQLAHYLKAEHETGLEEVIGVYQDRSPLMLVSILGILKAGGAYLPLDKSLPEERLAYMFNDAGVRLVLTDTVEDSFTGVAVCNLNDQQGRIVQFELANSNQELSGKSLAYVMYTSGSTGQPKGVMIEHHAVVNYASWANEAYFENESKYPFAVFTSLSFDLTVTSIWSTLLRGDALKVLPNGDEVSTLTTVFTSENIKAVKLTPSHVLALGALELTSTAIEVAIVGGEAFTKAHEHLLRTLNPEIRIYNEYGPTEATVGCTMAEINGNATIGNPIANSEVYVLNEENQLVPQGVKGRLFVGGKGLFRGYLNRSQQTIDQLITNPFGDGVLYNTGDLVSWDTSGNLNYHGRLDNQVKIHGYRIELGEIEAVIANYDNIESFAVTTIEVQGSDAIALYFTASEEEASTLGIRQYLEGKLPSYMIPTVYKQLTAIPLTSNGKLDKASLPKGLSLSTKEYEAPKTITEKLVAQLWELVLQVENVGLQDNFFELGGHSIKAIQLATKLNKRLGVQLTIGTIFSKPILKDQIDWIAKETSGQYQAIPCVAEQEYYPLSHTQHRTWLLVAQNPEALTFNVFNSYQLKGDLKLLALEAAFEQLIERHESLRTVFKLIDGTPKQQIVKTEDLGFSVGYKAVKISERDAVISKLSKQPFNLSTGPLLKVDVLRYGDDNYELLFSMHHIISDEWSEQVLVRDVVTIYNGIVAEKPHSLATLPIQYKDYAAWQIAQESTDEFEVSRAYWKSQLKEAPQLELASDRPRPEVMSPAGAQHYFKLNDALSNGIKAVSEQGEATLFMGVTALVKALLYNYTGQTDITIGTPVAGREHADVADQIGLYLNTLAIRTAFSSNNGFMHLLDQVKQSSLAGFNHQQYPFDLLIEELEVARVKNRAPLFDVAVILQNVELNLMEDLQMEGISVSAQNVDLGISKGDLRFQFIDRGDYIDGSIEYSTDLYDEDRIVRMITHMENILEAIIAAPETSLKDIEYLDEAETENTNWFANTLTTKKQPFLHQQFEAIVAEQASHIAIAEEEQETTYGVLNEKSNQLAHVLTDLGLSINDKVGVLLPSGTPLVSSLLACLKTGITYVPLSTDFSKSKLNQVMTDTQMKVLITDEASFKTLETIVTNLPFTHIVQYSVSGKQLLGDIDLGGTNLIGLNERECQLLVQHDGTYITDNNFKFDQHSKENKAIDYAADNSSYIFYTSGTTGKSKAIVGNQQSISQYINWHAKTFNVTQESRISQIAAVTFDASLKDILSALISGATLCIPSVKTKENMLLLSSWLVKENITVLQTVPSLFRLITDGLQQQNIALNSVTEVVLAGEKLYGSDVLVWRSFNDHKARISNLYGLTETTVLKSCYHIPEGNIEAGAVLPVGKAIDNAMIAVINDSGLSLWGELGEVYIKSPYVTNGYLDAALNKQLIVQNPLVSDRKDLVYRTGDIGRYDSEGNLELLGRIDDQIKLHGVRVDLDGIRGALLSIEGVSQVELLLHEDNDHQGSLLCYYSGTAINKEQLRNILAEQLDRAYMPDFFVYLDEFPLTLNGKVDKRALPKPSELLTKENFEAPQGIVEESLAGIWQEVLSLPEGSIGRDDSFFDLGGSSLKAIQLISRIFKKHEVQLSIGEIFNNGVLKEQATLIGGTSASDYEAISKAEAQEYYPLSHAQKRVWLIEQHVTKARPFNGVEVFRLEGNLEVTALEQAFDQLIERHESLRTVFELVNGVPVQKIVDQKAMNFSIRHEDISDYSEEARQKLLEEITSEPFNFTTAPLLRVALLKRNNTVHEIVLSEHHIISDQWSRQIVVRDLVSFYNEKVTGEAHGLNTLPIQYKDYTAWQNEIISNNELTASSTYWKEQLTDAPQLELASDRPRPEVMSHAGAQHNFKLSEHLSNGLKKLTQEEEATLFMSVTALVKSLLYRYTGQTDITIGTPVAGRDHTDLEDQIGLYLNALAIRTKFSSNVGFRALLDGVKQSSLAGFEHQQYPFDLLVEALGVETAKNRAPLFDVSVILQNVELNLMENLQMEGIKVSALDDDLKISKGDLRFQFVDQGDYIDGSIEYSTDLYDEDRIVRMVTHLENILEAVIAAPEEPLQNIEYLEEAEAENTNWFAKNMEVQKQPYLHQQFEAMAGQHASLTAIAEEEQSTTYGTLNEQSNQLAHLLNALGLSIADKVGVLLPSGTPLVNSLLACLKTGITYVPLSTDFSKTKLTQVMIDTEMKVLITDEASFKTLNTVITELPFTHIIQYAVSGKQLLGGLDLSGADLIGLNERECYLLEQENGIYRADPNFKFDQYSKQNPEIEIPAANSSYIFYTSGTTGKSKAIVGNQQSISQYINWHAKTFNVTKESRISQIAAVTFDASLKDILTALISGATLCIPSAKTKENMLLLSSWLAKEKVSILQTVPSLFRLITDGLQQQNIALNNVEEVVLAGEKLYGSDVLAWRSLNDHKARLSNLYGLTETTVLKSCYHVPEGNIEAGAVLPVGQAIDDAMIAVINEGGLSLWGELGEVYIKSPYITKGYLDTALNQHLIVQNPLVIDREDLVYRTGDIGRYDSEGNLELLGRIDDQIKLHGVRVDLDGIRGALLTINGITQVELLLHEDNDHQGSLLCYYSGKEINKDELRSTLAEQLDRAYMPDFFVYLDEFPLTLNGKVDKRALPKPSELLTKENYEAPQGAVEVSLAGIWQEVLSLPEGSIGRNDSFFDLGGSSLKAIQLISRIFKKHEVQLNIGTIFNNGVLKDQAALIGQSSVSDYEAIPKATAAVHYPLSHAQRRVWLIEQHTKDELPFNGLEVYRLQGNLDVESLKQSFNKLITRHESLRTVFELIDGEPRQRIVRFEEIGFELKVIHMDELEVSRTDLVQQLTQRPFNLSEGPLLRAELLVKGEQEYELLFSEHHIISDEWSRQVLVKELVTYYNSITQETHPNLEALPIQYKDYAVWEKGQLNTPSLQKAGIYWKNQLTEVTRIPLITDHQRPEIMNHKGAQHYFSFAPELSDALKQFTQQQDATLFMGVMALVKGLMYRYTGHTDITIGTPVAGRDHADLEDQIGLFINTLALRTQIEEDTDFSQLVAAVKETSLNGFEHQWYPFDLLVEELEADIIQNRAPIFDVVVILQNIDVNEASSLEMDGLKVTVQNEDLNISKGDLRFQFIDRGHSIDGSIEYNTSLYTAQRIEKMESHLKTLLQEMLDRPETILRKLQYLSEDQSEKVKQQHAHFAGDLLDDY